MSNEYSEQHRNAVDYLESLTETADCEPVEGWPASLPSRAAYQRDIEKKLTIIEGSTSFQWTRDVDANGITITVKGNKGKALGLTDSVTDHVLTYEAMMLDIINRHFRFEMRRDPAKEYTRIEEGLLCYYPEWRVREKEAKQVATLRGIIDRRRESAEAAAKKFEETLGHERTCVSRRGRPSGCSCLVQRIRHHDMTAIVEWFIDARRYGERMAEAGQN